MALKLSDAYQSSPIKSIQRGSVSGRNELKAIAISTVNPDKSVARVSTSNGYQGSNSTSGDSHMTSVVAGATLSADGTSIDIRFGGGASGGSSSVWSDATAYWEVIEYV